LIIFIRKLLKCKEKVQANTMQYDFQREIENKIQKNLENLKILQLEKYLDG
jgi:hypothetical protein